MLRPCWSVVALVACCWVGVGAQDVPNPVVLRVLTAFGMDRLDTRVTQADLDGAPKWLDDVEAPPLSPKKALDSARAELATWFSDADQWSVDTISLRPLGTRHDWIYT